jgi:hypothetical protein
MIPEEAKSEIKRKKAEGQSWTSLARWMKDEYGVDIHRTTIQRWHDKEVFSEFEDDIDELDSFAESEDRIRLDKKLATYKSEMTFYKKLYQQSLKDSTKKEVIVEAIKDNAPAFPRVKQSYNPFIGKKDGVKGNTPQVVVAPLSDTHVGDHVSLEQMAGLNSYDIDIFNRRLHGWATQLLNLVELRRNTAPIDKLIIPMLGDMVSGDIHEELARTNIDNCMQQMIRGANLIAQALMFLAPHFKEIEVPCVVGNHGRMTRKPPMKDKYMDWDYMLYQWVAAYLRNQKHIKFSIPKTFLNSFEVCNRQILIMHGDSISGAGSNMAITRAVTGLRSFLQFRKNLEDEVETPLRPSLTSQFDSVMMGHFHRIDEIDVGTGAIYICGTMKGGDEFAAQKLHTITKPKQLVTYWHPVYGNVGREVIYLNRYDEDREVFTDVLPEVWING